MPELADLTDDALDAHRIDILTEQERRARLAATPAQVAALTAQYIADGGDPAALTA